MHYCVSFLLYCAPQYYMYYFFLYVCVLKGGDIQAHCCFPYKKNESDNHGEKEEEEEEEEEERRLFISTPSLSLSLSLTHTPLQ